MMVLHHVDDFGYGELIKMITDKTLQFVIALSMS